MKVKDFSALLAELGSLTPVQRNSLLAALLSQRSTGNVIALIEAEFAMAPASRPNPGERRMGAATGEGAQDVPGDASRKLVRVIRTDEGPQRRRADRVLVGRSELAGGGNHDLSENTRFSARNWLGRRPPGQEVLRVSCGR